MNARIAIIFPIGEFTVDFNMFSGLSIAFMVSADVILMPGEALIKIISVIRQCKDRGGCFAGGAGSHRIPDFPEHHLRRQ